MENEGALHCRLHHIVEIDTMQASKILKEITSRFENMCRCLFWGHSIEKWGFHSVAWGSFASLNDLGDLVF